MGVAWSQSFPPPPTLTEKNLPTQAGKVFIVTGGASGVGFELCRILYNAGARVYMAGRSEPKARKAIDAITGAPTHTPSSAAGELLFLHLQLDDLSTIKASAEAFQAKESKLDVLWNNAGTGPVYDSQPTPQGHDFHYATNILGPYLFTQLLLPSLRAAGSSSRVVWTASMLVDVGAPRGGLDIAALVTSRPPLSLHPNARYTVTKVGNWFLAAELARRTGVLSVVQNPGNLLTEVWRHQHWLLMLPIRTILHPAVYGAYTELWAGLSEEVDQAHNGAYIVPWGRWHEKPREDILNAIKSRDEGGEGKAERFWDWCEEQTAPFR